MSIWRALFGPPDLPSLWTDLMRSVQTRLHEHGFNPGPIDGHRGPQTDKAIAAFKKAKGFLGRPYLGPLTIEALAAKPVEETPRQDEPRWLSVGRRYIGTREISGNRHSPAVVGFWKEVGAHWFDDDETPWCGGFVGAVLKRAGLDILPAGEAPRARAWASWGRKLNGPAVGAVVVFWRGHPDGTAGHVGFVVGSDERRRLMVLGGNQSNAVTIAPFDTSRVLAYRWPEGEPMPPTGWAHLPVMDSSAPSSRNEA